MFSTKKGGNLNEGCQAGCPLLPGSYCQSADLASAVYSNALEYWPNGLQSFFVRQDEALRKLDASFVPTGGSVAIHMLLLALKQRIEKSQETEAIRAEGKEVIFDLERIINSTERQGKRFSHSLVSVHFFHGSSLWSGVY